MKGTACIDEEDPGVFVKSLLKLANIVFIETIDVELHNSNDLVVVICSRGHVHLRFAGLIGGGFEGRIAPANGLSLIPIGCPLPPRADLQIEGRVWGMRRRSRRQG